MIMHAKKPRMLYEVGGMPADDFTNFRHVSEQDALMTARGVCKKEWKGPRKRGLRVRDIKWIFFGDERLSKSMKKGMRPS